MKVHLFVVHYKFVIYILVMFQKVYIIVYVKLKIL